MIYKKTEQEENLVTNKCSSFVQEERKEKIKSGPDPAIQPPSIEQIK
jgi:hypothetical protein